MIFINKDAYTEFKELLDESNVESYNIRICLDDYSCSGPVFGIYVSEATDEDEVEKINDINFIVKKSLLEQFGGFTIISNKENDNCGVGLKPIVEHTLNICESDGCSGCSGCQNCN